MHRIMFVCHADMPTSLRKQLVDRRRVVHGIAIGREQIENGGHPLDDTGTVRRERDEGQPKRGWYNGIG